MDAVSYMKLVPRTEKVEHLATKILRRRRQDLSECTHTNGKSEAALCVLGVERGTLGLLEVDKHIRDGHAVCV